MIIALNKKLEEALVSKAIIKKDLEDAKSQLLLLEDEKTLETQVKDLTGFELQAKESSKEVESLIAMLRQ